MYFTINMVKVHVLCTIFKLTVDIVHVKPPFAFYFSLADYFCHSCVLKNENRITMKLYSHQPPIIQHEQHRRQVMHVHVHVHCWPRSQALEHTERAPGIYCLRMRGNLQKNVSKRTCERSESRGKE